MPYLLFALLALILAAPARAATPAEALLESCRSGSAVFAATMQQRRPDERLAIRFTLMVREDGGRRWRRVDAPGFGSWTSPLTPARRFQYRKEVRNLAPAARYRTVVRFRWKDRKRDVTVTTVRRSPVCRQHDVRPDLRPGRVDARATGDPDVVEYVVQVRNTGRSDAASSALVLRVDDRPLPAEAVLGVPALGRAFVEVLGPPCTRRLVVTVDTEGQVEESDEEDDEVTFPCPPVDPE